ncbi:hypothetical protein KW805_02745 [Candidatus Pacearchaeota archaeon]|nr:hypothetical protein [Candidatus Pacearchaeota archaeon]
MAFTYGGATILQSPLFVELVLPFLLIFALVFAVLQKTKILGDGKRQLDAIVALVIGLIFVSFAWAVQLTVQLVSFSAVALIVGLVFLMMWGMFHEPGTFQIHKNVKMAVGILALIAVVIAVLVYSGGWEYIKGLFEGEDSSIATNAIIIIIVIIAVAAVVGFSGKSSGSSSH